jgi:hypothetical protein
MVTQLALKHLLVFVYFSPTFLIPVFKLQGYMREKDQWIAGADPEGPLQGVHSASAEVTRPWWGSVGMLPRKIFYLVYLVQSGAL